ncbi:SapC family protein [Kordiimonas marina]|uniref:SapC family protein n=1 Tax=Kordiimonas marina TaxID=2872312 RepID=UPI001FF19E97|nr:SapC family protein [Kordiimonas marina]MCJ9427757.1 SapC family protein [Kordiimonas marina]
MASGLQPINTAEHKDVKVNTEAGFDHIAATHLTPVTIHEFADVAANFPIVFLRDGTTGKMRAVALFGLAPGENLFVRDGKWLATYIPNHIGCLPFIPAGIDRPGEYAICLDADSPLVGEVGQPLYNEDGSESEFLGHVRKMLEQLVEQDSITQAFCDTLDSMDLLKEIAIQMADDKNQMRELNGIFTLNSQRLHGLDDEKMADLHKKGFLGGAYAINHSFAQIKRLLQMRNEVGENPITRVNVRDLDEEIAANAK